MTRNEFWRATLRWAHRSQFLTFVSILAGIAVTITGTLYSEYRGKPTGTWLMWGFWTACVFGLVHPALRFVASREEPKNPLLVSPGGVLTGGGVGKRNLAIRHQTFAQLLLAVITEAPRQVPRSTILRGVGFRLGRTYVKDFLLARRKREDEACGRKELIPLILDHDRDSGWGAAKMEKCQEEPTGFCVTITLDELVTELDSRDAQSVQCDEFLIGYYCGIVTELYFPASTDDQEYLTAKFESDPAKSVGKHVLTITRSATTDTTAPGCSTTVGNEMITVATQPSENSDGVVPSSNRTE